MFPRWLSLLTLVVIGYLIVTAMGHRRPLPVPLPSFQSAATVSDEAVNPATSVYPQLAAATDIEHWKRAINPEYAAHAQCEFTGQAEGLAPKVIVDHEGHGEAAQCTETVRVKLIVWSNRGAALYTAELALTLGSRQVAAGLDAALIGIKPGETRTVILPPEALVHAKKTDAPPALLHALKPDLVAIVTATRMD